MRRKTRALIGLEHVIGPAVVRRQKNVWIDSAGRIVNIQELWISRTSRIDSAIRMASFESRAIHLTATAQVVAHVQPIGLVRVAKIEMSSKRPRLRLSNAASHFFVEPIAGLDVVTAPAAPAAAVAFQAQRIKQVIRSSILLNDNDDVLKIRVGRSRRQNEQRHLRFDEAFHRPPVQSAN